MFILMTLFLIIGISLIGYSVVKWMHVNRFMFQAQAALSKIVLVGAIGILLVLISLFTLF